MSELVSAMIADSHTRHNKELIDVALRTAHSKNIGHKGTFSNHITKKVQTPHGGINVPVYDNEVVDFRDGPIQRTGNPYHAALSGDGFFVVQTANERQILTRKGNFSLNENLELVTAEGYNVMGEGGPIVLDPQQGPYKFNVDGSISNANGIVGRFLINTVTEDDKKSLRGAGEYFLKPENVVLIPAERYVLMQEAIEKSNAIMQIEAANLAEISKRTAALKKFSSEVYETRKTLIRDLGKIT